MKLVCLALGAVLSLSAPALALAACSAPPPPAAIDGAQATMAQLASAKDSVVAFMGASDSYQDCLIAELSAQKKAAKAARTKLDPAVKKATDDAISVNQADKEKVGGDFNAAVKAYKAAHPS
jgi:hypothetical protein